MELRSARPHKSRIHMSSYHPKLRTITIALGILFLIYAFIIEPNWLRVTQHDIPHRDGSSTIRIAQISDLHLHSIGSREYGVVDEIRRINPDLIVFTGDAVDRNDALPVLDEFLKMLSNTPMVAIVGNWEYWSGTDITKLANIYAGHGGQLLINQRTTMNIKGRHVEITGLDDYTAGHPRLTPAIYPSPNSDIAILLQHSPGMFDDIEFSRTMDIRLDLCLSGHTHGGQITLFGLVPWRPPGSGTFTAGSYITANCPLYISSGIGTSVLPARVGVRPELAIFYL